MVSLNSCSSCNDAFRVTLPRWRLKALDGSSSSLKMICRHFIILIPSLFAFTLAGKNADAQTAAAPIDSTELVADGSALARLTSFFVGQWRAPVCGIEPPQGEFVWMPGGDYCEWKSEARGRIGVQRDGRRHVVAITLNRNTNGEAQARAIVDSIRTVVNSWGLSGRECARSSSPAGDVRSWLFKRSGIGVHISQITPPSGLPRLLVIAVDNPNEVPEEICRAT